MRVKGIQWVGIVAADWNATVGFYRDVLGLSVRNEGVQPGPADAGVRFLEMEAVNGAYPCGSATGRAPASASAAEARSSFAGSSPCSISAATRISPPASA